ncbi:MAG: hypothetical protein M3O15_08435 [Acidobacteriota bacterium]|nr:hypothetical protein [Acidobacteriota bacterium]
MRKGFSQHARTALWMSCAVVLALLCRPAAAQIQIASQDGNTSLKLGVLGQVWGDNLDTTTGDSSSKNLFLRRVRLIGLFKLDEHLSVFFDTDAPNLGKGNADGTKNNADIFLQDFTVTYAFTKQFQLDGGMILLASGYNHNQSATSIMAIDLGPYTLLDSGPLTGRGGRDYGVQARGYLADDHLEYRAGVFQGLRGKDSTNAFRYTGRLAYYVFGPETGLTYRGTSLGKIQTLSLGGSFDVQKGYKNYDADLFWDQPVNNGDGLTLQVDYAWWDGHTFLPAIPKQKTLLAELGYYIHEIKLQPFLQYARQKLDVAGPGEKRYQAGLGYYFKGYNSNLKLAWSRIERDAVKKRNEITMQYQVFAF